jgi:hypothetical protein
MFVNQATSYHFIIFRYATGEALVLDKVGASPVGVAV